MVELVNSAGKKETESDKLHTRETDDEIIIFGSSVGEQNPPYLEIESSVCSTNDKQYSPSGDEKHQVQRTFTGDTCHKVFTSGDNLTQHKNEKLLSCNNKHAAPRSLKNHVCCRTRDKLYGHDTCDKTFTNRRSFTRHVCSPLTNHFRPLIVKQKRAETAFPCDVCGKVLNCASKLKTHLHVHTGEKPYKCDVCKMAFSLAHHLKRHSLLHSNVKPYVCQVCNKGFKKATSLKDHLITHADVKPHECVICGKKYSSKQSLDRHAVMHTKAKWYKCQMCDKTYYRASSLQLHQISHTTEKLYKCDICSRSFFYKNSLKKHRLLHARDKIEWAQHLSL